jgi:pantothenate synthetase
MVGKIPVVQAIEKITKAIDSEKLLRTEYVEIINSLTLQPINDWDEAEQIRLSCAVYADPVRLIDNIKLK